MQLQMENHIRFSQFFHLEKVPMADMKNSTRYRSRFKKQTIYQAEK
jgi:hypothetical protein